MALKSLTVLPSTYATAEVAAVELAAGVGSAEAIPATAIIENEDFTYSATTESSANKEAGNDPSTALDDQPGFTANWGAEELKMVRVIGNVDLVEHAISNVPEAGDTVQVAVYHNDTLALNSDEGLQAQTGSAIEFNVDGVLPVRGGDVLRVAAVSGGLGEAADWDAAPGELDLQIA